LSADHNVVQGHCLIRNGAASRVARTVAVEFEAIYAVCHPGRAKLHGFAIFGGSNGFWRTALLREVRMQGRMLTEDIDSSMRVLLRGRRIAYDPDLVSRELAPTTVRALWNQRMRWAQGWFQVSRRHLVDGWHSSQFSLRNKLGLSFLLGWREIYPWLSLQMWPLIAFLVWRAGGVGELDWMIPVFVLTTLFTTSVGPGQTSFAYRLAAAELRSHRRWFLTYLLVSSLFYTEFRNVIARVAQIKELTGERRWIVTSRS
jgi:cellulose synthase/poly-beta-1,6-N-acetylglucosamine synthase-like glycosyltransferase